MLILTRPDPGFDLYRKLTITRLKKKLNFEIFNPGVKIDKNSKMITVEVLEGKFGTRRTW